MRSSYMDTDVELLLKDISGMVEPLSTEEREKKIQSGIHYCEMLPLEYKPTEKYIRVYEQSLVAFAQSTANAVASVSAKIYEIKGKDVVLVSLARAGTPVGILIKRYMLAKYKINVPHYSISIIRDRGIDKNAINFILNRHKAQNIMFVDGWVGKGAIFSELRKELECYPDIQADIAVLADPANLTNICGTHDDILIPSSCLNCTVSGLVSRTFLRSDIIGQNDFHGAAYYGELASEDRTYEFIDRIVALFRFDDRMNLEENVLNSGLTGPEEVQAIACRYGIDNINLVKPGIGETTRVLLRRVPWKILVNKTYKGSSELAHVFQLAKEKNVKVEYVEMVNYKCCGLIKKIADA